jgi:Helix-turn-helix domain
MRAQDKHTPRPDEHARGILIEQDAIEDDDVVAIAEYEAAKNTNEESFPAWMVEKLIAGEHPLKVFREYRGLTDKQLAESVGSSLSLLRQIEARERRASEGELASFAGVLQVDIKDLS